MRLTIGRKLNSLILLLQVLSIGGAVTLATELFTSDLTGLLRKGTLDTANMLSGRIRAEMKTSADRARTLGVASLEEFRYPEDRIKFIQDNLATDQKLIGLSLFRIQKNKDKIINKAQWRIVNPNYKKTLDRKSLKLLDEKFPVNVKGIESGNVDFKVATASDGTPMIRMGLPFVKRKNGTFSQYLLLEIHQEKISTLFTESTNFTSFLIDPKGTVLGSTDPTQIILGKSIKNFSIVERSLQNPNQPSGQQDYEDPSGNIQMAAFQSVGFSGLRVFSQVPMARATLAQKTLYRRTGLLAGFFLCTALFLGFLFSQGITKPIRALAFAAEKVKEGDFSVRLEKGKKSGGDEVQVFSSTFNEMVEGLEEREKIKSTFAKFHSKEVADKILSGELTLGGERKDAFVFFSDVRGFTAMSENMDPETLVTVLNRYMTSMVKVIIEHGGIVDKYVGDAIMAVWGVPLQKPGDGIRAVRACIEMRKELARLNEEFIEEGFPELKIGMGLNYGPLISGNIGSEERMEFTVIGDSVNTASRIESLTKSMGTDLLISQSVVDQLENKMIIEKAHEARVKGKSESLTIYFVNGYYDDEGAAQIVETKYSSYAAEKSDKVVDSGTEPSISLKTLSQIDTPAQTTSPPPKLEAIEDSSSEDSLPGAVLEEQSVETPLTPVPPSLDEKTTASVILEPLNSEENQEKELDPVDPNLNSPVSTLETTPTPPTLETQHPTLDEKTDEPTFEPKNPQKPKTLTGVKPSLPPPPSLDAVTFAKIHLDKVKKQEETKAAMAINPKLSDQSTSAVAPPPPSQEAVTHAQIHLDKAKAQEFAPSDTSQPLAPQPPMSPPQMTSPSVTTPSGGLQTPTLEEVSLSDSDSGEIHLDPVSESDFEMQEEELLEGANQSSFNITKSDVMISQEHVKLGGLIDGTETGIEKKIEKIDLEIEQKTKKSA